jgi:hypothetical protein
MRMLLERLLHFKGGPSPRICISLLYVIWYLWGVYYMSSYAYAMRATAQPPLHTSTITQAPAAGAAHLQLAMPVL